MSGTSIAHRYFNTYTTNSSSAKPGDALDLKWHSASVAWFNNTTNGFYRGGSFGVFGYSCNNTSNSSYMYGSRAVVVSGAGL